MNNKIYLFAFAFILFLSSCSDDDDNVTSVVVDNVRITFIGNQGVFISDEDEGILIDAIGDFGDFFVNVPADVQESINNVEAPYNKTTTVMITHGHGDHYSTAAVTNFVSSTNTRLFLPGDLRDTFPSLETNMEDILLNQFEVDVRSVGNAKITTINTAHFDRPVFTPISFDDLDNYAYIVELNGKKILHVGDLDFTTDNFNAITNAVTGDIDVVILATLGTLVSQENADLTNQFFPNSTIVVAHIQGDLSDVEGLQQFFPNAIIFDEPLEFIDL